MRFTSGLWEHEKFMDVFIRVEKVQYQDYKRAKLIVTWWNKGWTGKPWQLSLRTRLKIENVNGWRRLKDPTRKVSDYENAKSDS